MALVFQTWQLIVQLIDRGGNETTRTFDFIESDDAGDISTLASHATDHLADLAAVSLAKIKKYSLQKVYVEDALTLPTDAGAEVEAHALVSAKIQGVPNESATIDIPAPVPGIFAASSGANYNVVDVADTDLANYMNNFRPAANSGLFYVSDGESIAASDTWTGKRTHSKSRKG